ncbi:probable pectinesterase 29 [Andrographis paniculata]|uniref:probable pectinesterase 29 n=1 Tax=Andrographis paniculata TaxID=175694 RepID=UPI0021E6E1C1|nr:probable pectinesterase 29 [Andrographis paniculata]
MGFGLGLGFHQKIIFAFLVVFLGSSKSTLPIGITSRRSNYYKSIKIVDPSGHGNFRTIQEAIDSVPPYSQGPWNCIYIKPGIYREQIKIPYNKPFIYLKGAGKKKTFVVWDAHDSISTSATFTSDAQYTFAKSITFVNSYNNPAGDGKKRPMKAAVAALINGDKSAFDRCGFLGLQDTLWDANGRHYFTRCTIQGAVDFIFGAGQSIYQDCTISVTGRALNGGIGFITAQARSGQWESNGFVFKECRIVGNGQTYLGRPWRDYARVLFYNTTMSRVVVPQGWDSWLLFGRENRLTFAEYGCHGEGANTTRRVPWLKTLSKRTLTHLTNISFIDDPGWMSMLPLKPLHCRLN